MKKENVFGKILTKAIIGIPVWITFLMLSYVSVYFIAGEAAFDAELNQLHNIRTFILQLVTAGISGYAIFICFYLASSLTTHKMLKNNPSKAVIIFVCIIIVIISILSLSLGNTNIFSSNIATLNIIILVISYALAALVLCIKDINESLLIKKINQKLKEKNSHQ